MELVILDSFTAVSTNLSLKGIFELCPNYRVYEQTAPKDLVERIGNAELLLINKTILTEEILSACPNIKYIGLFATGYNNVDIQYCKKRGIVVSNAPAYSTNAVAQFTMALILSFFSMVEYHSQKVKDGVWQNSESFTFYNPHISELSGKTMGILGYGNIGRKVAKLASAFDMRLCIHTRTPHPVMSEEFEFVSLERLLKESDILSLHCPLFPETREIINKSSLAQMKNTAYLINTARGGLVEENSLAQALNDGCLAGAGLDVLTIEPPLPNTPLLKAKNCIITPHIAWAAKESRERLIAIVEENLRAFLDGTPLHSVSV